MSVRSFLAMFSRWWDCPICHQRVYVKSAALHFEGHLRHEPELVEAWRRRA